MVSLIDQAQNISQAVVINNNNNNNNSNNINNISHSQTSDSISSMSSTTTTLSSIDSQFDNDDNDVEYDNIGNNNNRNNMMSKSSSFSVADTDTDIDSEIETEASGLLDELNSNNSIISSNDDCPPSPSPTRANTTGSNSYNNPSIFHSVLEKLQENEKLSSYTKSTNYTNNNNSNNSIERKYTIVLDLDETLLHSFFPEKVTPAQYQYVRRLAQSEAHKLQAGLITFEERAFHEVDVGDGTIVVAHIRPYMWSFLRSLFQSYNVAVWSAGGRLYVDNMCKLLFPVNTPQPIFSLCWEDCHLEQTPQTAHYVYTKPMHILTNRFPNLSLSHLILVDNRRENGLHYPEQVVHAPDFFECPWLNALKEKKDLIVDNYLQFECLTQIQFTINNIKQLYNNQNNEFKSMHDTFMDDELDEQDWQIHSNNNNNNNDDLNSYDLLSLVKELQNQQVNSSNNAINTNNNNILITQ